MLDEWLNGPRTGVACQRQHWSSHKRQCRALAEDEYLSTYGHRTREWMLQLLDDPDPSGLPLLPKLSAITWTLRPDLCYLHFQSLVGRALCIGRERPAPSDTKEKLVRLFKRAAPEIPWLELPGGAEGLFRMPLRALTVIDKFGEEPEAAVEILSRHTEYVERHMVAPRHVARYCLSRLGWTLAAAVKFKGDEAKRGAYVAEAKGLMERATGSLRGLHPEDWLTACSSEWQLSEECTRIVTLTLYLYLLSEATPFCRELIRIAPVNLRPDYCERFAVAMLGLQKLDEAEELVHSGLEACGQNGLWTAKVSRTTG
jgi:hypothetical protein